MPGIMKCTYSMGVPLFRKFEMTAQKDMKSNLIDIYLISNRYPAKWDLGRPSQAILDTFRSLQRV